ncbi:MAG TPA: ATP-binding protein, partial [Nautiliaceae bacterium]|nr:ATP-binding protein [Nautiliaceae bacterium]
MEEKVERYLLDKKEDIKSLEVRERLLTIKPTKEAIISIIGPRRAGKTFFLYFFIKNKKLLDKDFVFINFEEIEAKNISSFIEKHIEIYGKFPEYVFLDEIQALPKWEKEVYKLYEKKKYNIFITGSNSKLLSKEIATQLRGRTVTTKVFPFSFKEILNLNNLNKKFFSTREVAKIKSLLKNVLKEGCFPSIVLKKIESKAFISELIDLVIYKDIMERYGIENRVALEFFIKSVIASNAKKFSVNKVYNTAKSMQIKVSKDTLYQFQNFLEDVNMVFFLRKYTSSLKKTYLSLPKSYVIDNGFYYFTTYRYDIGYLMESFVFQELIKRGFEPNKTLFYFENNYEVDFVIKEGLKIKQLIQVTYASNKDEIEKREIKSLIKAFETFKKDKPELLVITWDYEDEETFERKRI